MDRHLSQSDRSRIISLYEDRFDTLGYDVRTVGWGSRADQFLRFQMLSRGISFAGKRVLDLGCGFGDFIGFLRETEVSDYAYVGVDLSTKLVEEADRRFGDERHVFKAGNLLEMDLGTFDIVICSGALSFKIDDNVGLAHHMLKRMYECCTEAVCVNFLSSRVDYTLEKNFHYDPGAMLSFALSLSRRARILHDYPLYEFTLQLLREPSPSTDNV